MEWPTTQKEIEKKIKEQQRYIKQELKKRMTETVYHDGMTREECLDAFLTVILLCDHHTTAAWDYFMKVYPQIPKHSKLLIQLAGIYTGYHFRADEFFTTLAQTIAAETPQEKLTRLAGIRAQLEPHITQQDEITIHRGFTAKSIDEDLAISYTLDKERAEWFSTRFNDPSAQVITKTIQTADILYYTNSREEQEVIIQSPILKSMVARSR